MPMFERVRKHWRPLVAFTLIDAAATVVAYKWYSNNRRAKELAATPAEKHAALQWKPPTRIELFKRLTEHSSPERPVDLLIIGGGATGTGCALDAAVKGLSVACVEREDWSSGTSSKSTKLVHGGVRYLEKAIRQFDLEQYKLVDEALRERSTFLQIAPHLTDQLPIMLPIYKWYLIPYFWVGSKAYDLVAGAAGLQSSYFLSRSKALKIFPMLKADGLAGAMVYYDGVQNDARTNVTLALTALYHGAIVTNYTRVVELIKDEADGSAVKGAIVEDVLTGKRVPVHARAVINATGPFCDAIRRMDDQACEPIVSPSAGTHIVLPNYFSPRSMGLIDPSTSDGRVLFFLPWEGNVISGTTDAPAPLEFNPKAKESEIEFILGEIDGYLTREVTVRRSDVLAAWAGIRPLVRDPSKASAAGTEGLVRNHLILESPSGLITISGGKWTTYRNMADETVNYAIQRHSLQPKNPRADTSKVLLLGAHDYSDTTYLKVIQRFGLETDVAQHLARSYGDRAVLVGELCADTKLRWPLHGRRLHNLYPYDEAEVIYACRYEYAETAVDVLARRTRLAFLSVQAAKDALPRVIQLMAKEKGWSQAECRRQNAAALDFLKSMGLDEVYPHRAQFDKDQVNAFRQAFGRQDRISRAEAVKIVKQLKSGVPEREIEQAVRSVDPDESGMIGFADFLEMLSHL